MGGAAEALDGGAQGKDVAALVECEVGGSVLGLGVELQLGGRTGDRPRAGPGLLCRERRAAGHGDVEVRFEVLKVQREVKHVEDVRGCRGRGCGQRPGWGTEHPGSAQRGTGRGQAREEVAAVESLDGAVEIGDNGVRGELLFRHLFGGAEQRSEEFSGHWEGPPAEDLR